MENNEHRCCSAILNILEERHSARPRIRSIDTPATPGIDVRCEVGGKRYAIEHTGIDPYPQRREDDRQFLGALEGFENSSSILLKPGSSP